MSAGVEFAVNARLVRYADLIPCYAHSRDSCECEAFIIMGDAAAEGSQCHVHIAEPCSAAIHAIRYPNSRVGALYLHEAAEVVIVHLGHWRLRFGPNGDDGSVDLGPGDVASVSPDIYRCVDKADEGVGFLLSVRAPRNELQELEAATVFQPVGEATPRHLSGRRWIDTSSGAPVLRETNQRLDEPPMPWTPNPAAFAYTKYNGAVLASADMKPNSASSLSGSGVEEAGIIVPRATRDGFEPGPLKSSWPHGFNLRLLVVQSGGYVPLHTRAESEVLFVHEGAVEIRWPDGAVMLAAGDTLSLPIGIERSVRNTTSRPTRIFVVRGSEDPAMPMFSSMPPHASNSPI